MQRTESEITHPDYSPWIGDNPLHPNRLSVFVRDFEWERRPSKTIAHELDRTYLPVAGNLPPFESWLPRFRLEALLDAGKLLINRSIVLSKTD